MSTPLDFDLYKKIANATGVTDYSHQIIHYTSTSNLAAMLASKELWFGKINSMNDLSEFDHFLDAVLEMAPRFIVGNDIPGAVEFVSLLRNAIKEQSFVSSWCEYFDLEPNGRLGMWRTYGYNGHGVGVVVDTSQFQPSVLSEKTANFHVMTAKVEYVAANRAVDLANNLFRRLSTVEIVQPTLAHKFMMGTMLLAKAPTVKHEGFAEEEEVRFVYLHGMLQMLQRPLAPPTSFRRSSDGRSFFALPLRDYPEFGLDLAIPSILRRVVVGPALGAQARAIEIRRLLDQHHLEHVPITVSSIPMR